MASPAKERITPAETIPQLIRESILVRDVDHCALIADGGNGARISYAELGRRVGGLAGGLRSLGVRGRDRVALLSENRPEWAISYLAILSAGATVVPLDALLKAEEQMALLQESRPRAILISSKFIKLLQERLHERLPDMTVINLDADDGDSHSFVKLLSGEPYLCSQIDPDQTASLIFTSGTTGKPKAVQLTHRNISSNINAIFQALEFSPSDRFLSVLPLSHVYECTAGFLVALAAGASITYARSLAGPSLIEDLRNNNITILVGVPLLFEKMRRGMERKIKQAPFVRRVLFSTFYGLASVSNRVGVPLGRALFGGLREKAGMGALRLMVSGGAPLDPQIAHFFENLGFNFLEGYGMTECSPVIAINRPGRSVIGSVGPALPGCELMIDAPNREGIGEILVRSASVTPGYLNDAAKTSEILRDGWLVTGDLGKIENGNLYISGRSKNLIISAGGKNIYPEEIETRILESKLIAEVLVIGRKQAGKQGEQVTALIFPDSDELSQHIADLKSDGQPAKDSRTVVGEIVAAVNRSLADYKRIASWEIVETEFEKTASRKIKRSLYR